MAIHSTAIVSSNAKIGKNVEIGPYAVIEDDCVIGDDCFIDSHVKICRYTTVGDRSRFYLGALVGEEPQDHRMKPLIKSNTEIGSDTVIREYVTIHRSPFEDGLTKVGNNTLLMAFVHVAHDCIIGNHVTCANHTALSGHVVVDDGAVMSGYIMMHQFGHIGSLAMISPGVKMRQDVPPFCLVTEQAYICGSNVVGLRRAGLSSDERSAIKKAIRLFFFKGLNSTQAFEAIEKSDFHNKYTAAFVDFIRNSKRGIIAADPEMVALGTKIHIEDEED